MVNRLRKSLNGRTRLQQNQFTGSDDVTMANDQTMDDFGPRELDDEELDAENIGEDDFDEYEGDDGDVAPIQNDDADDNIPQNAYILPLYSLLSADEQAKVFAPVPEGHRLIVIATKYVFNLLCCLFDCLTVFLPLSFIP